MAISLNGTTGITTPGITNTGAETVVDLTTTGNTILGDASGDTLTVTGGTTTFTQGTANGVAFLNGSKVLTTGSANLTFNGTTLTANTIGAFTLGGTIAGGGNNINNVVIGASSPLAGNFTTLTTSSTVTHNGGTANGVAYLNGSKVLTSGSALTFDGTSLFNTAVAGNNQTPFIIIRNSTSGTAAGSAMYWGNDASFFNGIITKFSSAHTSKPSYFEINNTDNAPLTFIVNSAEVGRFSSAGLAVTGTLSATGVVTQTGANPTYYAKANNSGIGSYYITNAAGTDYWRMYSSMGAAGEQNFFAIRDVAGGNNILTLESTGAAVVGTLSASTSISTGTGNSTTAGLKLINGTAGFASGWGAIYAETITPSNLNFVIAGRWDGQQTNINTASGGLIINSVNNTEVTRVSSTGLAVTGTLSATGDISFGTGQATTAGLAFRRGSTTGSSTGFGWIYPENLATSGNNYAFGAKYDGTNVQMNAVTGGEVYQCINGSGITTVSSTGLAVTGTFTSSGNGTINGTALVIQPTTTTSFAYIQYLNASGAFYTGIDNSTGASFTGIAYGRFIYSGGAYPLSILTNDTERMRISSAGDVTVSTGNLIIGTAGKGIDFSVTASGSGTMTSELLADYEEGTFTPTVEGDTTVGTASYVAQNGAYVKVGKLVSFQLYLDWNSGTGGGFLFIGGLPFTTANDSIYPAVSLGFVSNIALTANTTPIALLTNNNTKIYFYQVPSGGGTNIGLPYDSAGSLIIAGTYRSAS